MSATAFQSTWVVVSKTEAGIIGSPPIYVIAIRQQDVPHGEAMRILVDSSTFVTVCIGDIMSLTHAVTHVGVRRSNERQQSSGDSGNELVTSTIGGQPASRTTLECVVAVTHELNRAIKTIEEQGAALIAAGVGVR